MLLEQNVTNDIRVTSRVLFNNSIVNPSEDVNLYKEGKCDTYIYKT